MSSNVKIAYGSPANFSLTGIGSLANSATGVAGVQSAIIDNTANLYIDVKVGGKIQSGTTPTSGSVIEVWAFAATDYSVPTYPDTLTGSAGTVTFTSRDIAVASMVPVASLGVSSTSNINNWFGSTGLAARFGGLMPAKWGIVVINISGVALHATDGNHVITYTPEYLTVG
jgi:hypothetical protein